MRQISRKEFIQTTSAAAAGSLLTPHFTSNSRIRKIKVVAFDAFAIFDPRPILKAVEHLFPDQAKQIIDIWQSRQFTYQWLRLLGNKYKNFWDVTKDALDFALLECGIGGHEKERDLVMAAYEDMHAWPDVDSSLQQLKQENVGVCFLSNMMEKMLRNGIENSNLAKYFDAVISTDEKQTYKPSRKAYQMTVEKLKLSAEQILFVPFAAWDMAGAKWFGYPTFWMNKLNSHREQLGVEPDGSGNTLNDLLEFIRKRDE